MGSQKRSGWFYLFVGCGLLALGAIVVVGAGIFMTVRWSKDVQHEMDNLELRTARGVEVLKAERLPDGYHVMVHMSAPFGFGKMVILSDGEAKDKVEDLTDVGEHLAIYLQGPGWDSDWREFLRGGPPPFDSINGMNFDVGRSEEIATGTLTIGSMELFYQANRGELAMNEFREDDGVYTVMMIRCQNGGKRSHTLVWMGPPAPGADARVVIGTTGDPARIREFVGHFDFCG